MEWIDVTGQPYNEEHFLEDLTWRHPVLGNALARNGFTLQKLRELAPANIPNREMTRVVFTTPVGTARNRLSYSRYDQRGRIRWTAWDDLFDIANISYRRILQLVNYLRWNGVELPWFAKWDLYSANWTALKGQHRELPPTSPPGQEP